MTIAEQPIKYKTTLYLTEENRKRLKQISKVNMTKIINQAIAEKLEQLERKQAREKLLDSLGTGKLTPANGVSTEKATRILRQQSVNDAVKY